MVLACDEEGRRACAKNNMAAASVPVKRQSRINETIWKDSCNIDMESVGIKVDDVITDRGNGKEKYKTNPALVIGKARK